MGSEAFAPSGVAAKALQVAARRRSERRKAKTDPAYLMSFMSAPDERTGELFTFEHLRAADNAEKWAGLWPSAPASEALKIPNRDWSWQRDAFLWLYHESRTIALKARQLGFTWLGCGACVVDALIVPGSLCLIYRQKEEEAVENVRRCWALFESLPVHLRMGVEVLTPARGSLPSVEIKLRHPDGSISRIVAMTSASASGHGKTARRVILDEHSRIDRAGEIIKAVQPAAGLHGKIGIISTANGRSNAETGDGNQFHWTWEHAEEGGWSKRFLSWALHPDRDQDWYDNAHEVRGLKSHERAEQYPANEHEAFALTNRTYFEAEDLEWYAENAVRQPLYRANFTEKDNRLVLARGAEAVLHRTDRGHLRVYLEPITGHSYAIGADVATGRGRDYSCAYVIDLATMEFAAELHCRIDEDQFAAQLHYLGKWYGRAHTGGNPADPAATGSAKLAIEVGGGYGNAVIASLRDRTAGRPAYPNLYRQVLDNRGDRPIAKPWGFSMNSSTRPKVINGIDKALREHALPWVTAELLHEYGDFVHHDHGTSPAAADGTNDDRVLSSGIALEMFRLYGHHASKPKHKPRRSRIVGLGRAA
jgi:hypothetical protein